MTEIAALHAWIKSKLWSQASVTDLLGGSVDPRIYPEMAPENTAFPYVVFQMLSGDDINLQDESLEAVQKVMVKAVDQGQDVGNCDAIMAAINPILHGSVTVQNGFRINALRTGTRSLPDAQKGEQYRQILSTYEVTFRPEP